MKRHKQYIWAAIAVVLFLIGGCQTKEIIDENETETGQLHFSPTLGGAETATRAAESDNGVLQTASAANASLSHIVINTYTSVSETSLKEYFSDKLGYFDSRKCWDVTSENKRFLPTGGMNLYAYFATNCSKQADLANVTYIHPTADTDHHPKLTFTVAEEGAFSQVDLVAAKVVGITSPNVSIPLRHILSQINFGVKGMDQHKIKVTNICINKVKGAGSFDYNTWQWTPNADTELLYPYYFPDRKEAETNSGLGDTYTTLGTADDSQNSYLFGDGGKFGPGEEDTFLYAQVNPSPSNYATKANTLKYGTPLNNSLMLLPQKIKENKEATVTFDYEVKLGDQVIRTATDNVVRLDAYYDWEPNMRYVYLFKFDDPEKITFDVLLEPWIESPGNIETGELNSNTLFENHVRAMKAGGSYEVPLGELSSNFVCEWSLYALDNSFSDVNQSFSLSFNSQLSFKNGKAVIIKPPFGFKATPSALSAPGTVTFTPIYPYFISAEEVNSVIGGGGNFVFSVGDKVNLTDIDFTGPATAERSLTLRYLSPYSGSTPSPDKKWQIAGTTAVCFPNDYAVMGNDVPYTYTIYTIEGLKEVFDWMNMLTTTNPGGSNATATYPQRMQTNINLAANGKYDLAAVYKKDGNSKPQYIPLGRSDEERYTGTFDGKGATVENLSIDINALPPRLGLIGYLGGTVQFVNMTNVYIFNGAYGVGGVVGENRGWIRGCSASGNMHADGFSGGIAGINYATIYSSASTAQTTSNNNWNGSIAGHNGGTIQGSYATGKDIPFFGAGSDAYVTQCFYVAPSNIGINKENVITRVPSIAALNGKIPLLNGTGAAAGTQAHFISGSLNETPPSIAAGNPAPRGNKKVLEGTFIQNWYALGWTQEQWNKEMAVLAAVGMKYLVIDQVMELSDFDPNHPTYVAWYQASNDVLVNDKLGISGNTALEFCMNACRMHDIKLYIGTFFDKRYWDNGAATKGKATEWHNCITTANNVMDELIAKYFHGGTDSYNDVLAGWYFPYEVDDLSFKTPGAKTILKTGISKAMTHRNELTNTALRKPYLFSPFMNGNGGHIIGGTMDSEAYAALWSDIIETTNFRSGDILSPQDCIGTDKLTIADIHDWMPKLRDATNSIGVEFWINVELFGFTNTNFLITQQIDASAQYATKLISFSYPIHYSPYSGANMQGDHDIYKAYYDAQ